MAFALLCIAGGAGLAGYGVSCLAGNNDPDAANSPTAFSSEPSAPAAEAFNAAPSSGKADMMKASLTPETLEAKKAEGKPFVLVIYAPWCSACRYFSGTYKKAVTAGLPLASLDGDLHADAVSGVEAFPTLVLYDASGKEVKRHVGGMDVGALKKFVRSA